MTNISIVIPALCGDLGLQIRSFLCPDIPAQGALLSNKDKLLLYLHQQYCQFMMYLCKQDLKMKRGLPPLPLGEAETYMFQG